MIFQDNVIKEYLKNVIFITGTPCGGKTTISRELAKRHNLLVYDVDEQFDNHRRMSNPAYQPSMNQNFNGADDFFGRTIEVYRQWLIDNTREQLDFVLLDLMHLSQNQIVVCDGHLTMEQAAILTEPSRIVFLLKDPSNIVEDYCNRKDHRDFSDFINSASDVEKAKAVCNGTLKSLNEKAYNEIKNSEYFWIERTNESTIYDTIQEVEKHLGLNENKLQIEIKKVDKNTELANQLIQYVENFSWDEVKEHVLWMLHTWNFTDWETMFVAIADDKIVGITSLLKTDYYPLPEIYPWVSCVFVSEDYRGHRISNKLIDFANEYARNIGFDKTYIPSEHIGLYEKYGYHYLKNITNYGNGIDRLYVKEII